MSDSSASSQSCLTIQSPLSKCGRGPGLILIQPLCYSTCQEQNKTLDPEPLKKWAEESFTVALITIGSSVDLSIIKHARLSLTKQCADGKVGMIGQFIIFLVDMDSRRNTSIWIQIGLCPGIRRPSPVRDGVAGRCDLLRHLAYLLPSNTASSPWG